MAFVGNRRYDLPAGPVIIAGNCKLIQTSYNGSGAVSGDGHCIAFSSRGRNRSVALIRLVMAVVALLFVNGCNFIGGEGHSESGIAGDGVTTGGILSKAGDGSSKGWSSATCQLVEGKTQWRWGRWQDSRAGGVAPGS